MTDNIRKKRPKIAGENSQDQGERSDTQPSSQRSSLSGRNAAFRRAKTGRRDPVKERARLSWIIYGTATRLLTFSAKDSRLKGISLRPRKRSFRLDNAR